MKIKKIIYCTVLGSRVFRFMVSHNHFTIAMSVNIASDYILFRRVIDSFMSQYVLVVIAEGHF